MIRLNLLQKDCSRCGDSKILKKFRLHIIGKYGRHSFCRVCERLYRKEEYHSNPSKYNQRTVACRQKNPEPHRESAKKYYSRVETDSEMHWRHRIASRYGLSLSDYNRMLSIQNGLCDICKKPPKSGKRLVVDHNHINGRVRALLCGNCNSVLGLSHENVSILTNAMKYLQVNGEIDIDWDVDNLRRKLAACGI